jgi:anti-sigma factor RsiW
MANPQNAIMRAELVHAYVDGELDPINSLAIGQQIADDPALAREARQIEALRNAIRDRLPREPLPSHLKARIETAIGRTSAPSPPSWRALAASVVVGMALASGSTWLALGPVSDNHAGRVAEAVVDSHLRALMAPQSTDVQSSERHVVKPWFNGRIPQAPQVIDLTSEGFPLVGARVDVVDAQPVAALAYGRRLHLISVLAVPTAGTDQEPSLQKPIKGTNLVYWMKDRIGYWAISDLNAGELKTFARSFLTALQPR